MKKFISRNDDAIAMKEEDEKKIREKYFFILLYIKIIKVVLTKNIITMFFFCEISGHISKDIKMEF